MNTSTVRRLGTTTVAIIAATALAAPAANAQRDLLPTGPEGADTRPATAWSDSADIVTDHKLEMAGVTKASTDRVGGNGTRLREGLAGDIAYAVETRKTEYARFRIDHAGELAANR